MQVKQCLPDSSRPGGFARGQAYFRGAVQLLRGTEAEEVDVRRLYSGRLALEDLPKAIKGKKCLSVTDRILGLSQTEQTVSPSW